MRIMVLVKASKGSEAGEMPSTEFLEAMGAFNERLVAARVIADGDGFKPSSAAVRVTLGGDQPTVEQGPFAPAEELVAGYWIWNVESLDDAIEWAKQAPSPGPGLSPEVLELRPFVEIEDFGDAITPALIERENRLRAAIEGDG